MHIPALPDKHSEYSIIRPSLNAKSMKIATWNVNSIRQRMDNLQAWLKERAPDIVCLQEIKCTDDAFPREPF